MHARRVRSAQDVERLRQLRNESRKNMTGSTKLISKAAQAKWWAAGERRAWLFGDDGFAYVRREHGVNWITLGVTKKARGKGLGTLIYATFPGTYARIREDNEASRRAATKAGFVPVRTEDDVVVMASFHR
jgi:RimJ/RimL family protein N-acetyltransferase